MEQEVGGSSPPNCTNDFKWLTDFFGRHGSQDWLQAPLNHAVTSPNKKRGRARPNVTATFVTAAARIRAEGNNAKCSGTHYRTASAVPVGRARVKTSKAALQRPAVDSDQGAETSEEDRREIVRADAQRHRGGQEEATPLRKCP